MSPTKYITRAQALAIIALDKQRSALPEKTLSDLYQDVARSSVVFSSLANLHGTNGVDVGVRRVGCVLRYYMRGGLIEMRDIWLLAAKGR